MAANGGQILGQFIQTNAKDVQFSELVSIAEKDGSLELRLKHFKSDLTGWENKDEIVRFPLVGVSSRSARFAKFWQAPAEVCGHCAISC